MSASLAKVYPIEDDTQFMLDLLSKTKVFNWRLMR